MALRDGLELLGRTVAAGKRAPRVAPYLARVASLSPLEVVLADDPDQAQLGVATNAAGALQVGWVVLVQIAGGRLAILSTPDQVASLAASLASLGTTVTDMQPWGGRIFALESTVNTTPSTRNATLRSDITALQSAVGGLPEIQSGTASMNISASTVAAGVVGNITITFPKAFGSAPRVMLNTRGTAQALQQFKLHAVSVATGSVSVRASSTIANNLAVNNVPVEWLAIN